MMKIHVPTHPRFVEFVRKSGVSVLECDNLPQDRELIGGTEDQLVTFMKLLGYENEAIIRMAQFQN